jgi:hypothetical protein
VKRILGTAEDYRRLYGGGLLTPGSLRDVAPAKALAKPKKPVKKKAPVKKTR